MFKCYFISTSFSNILNTKKVNLGLHLPTHRSNPEKIFSTFTLNKSKQKSKSPKHTLRVPYLPCEVFYYQTKQLAHLRTLIFLKNYLVSCGSFHARINDLLRVNGLKVKYLIKAPLRKYFVQPSLVRILILKNAVLEFIACTGRHHTFIPETIWVGGCVQGACHVFPYFAHQLPLIY